MNAETRTAQAEWNLENGNFGFWIFLAMETMFFGGIFFLYSNERFFYPEAFKFGSHLLDLKLGTLNTAVLLTSSLTMALAQYYLKLGEKSKTIASLVVTALLGCGFLMIKSIELSHDYSESLIPGLRFSQPAGAPQQEILFQGLYLFAISLHAFHLVIGILWCTGLIFFLSRQIRFEKWRGRSEALGLYWHFVDIIWIFLFPLFYLIGGTR